MSFLIRAKSKQHNRRSQWSANQQLACRKNARHNRSCFVNVTDPASSSSSVTTFTRRIHSTNKWLSTHRIHVRPTTPIRFHCVLQYVFNSLMTIFISTNKLKCLLIVYYRRSFFIFKRKFSKQTNNTMRPFAISLKTGVSYVTTGSNFYLFTY